MMFNHTTPSENGLQQRLVIGAWRERTPLHGGSVKKNKEGHTIVVVDQEVLPYWSVINMDPPFTVNHHQPSEPSIHIGSPIR